MIMKTIVLFLCLSSFLPAKIWIELAKEADYHLDHPGRRNAKVTPNSPDLDYLHLSRSTLEKISSGTDARCPTKSDDWFFKVTGCLLDLNHLLEFQASQQDWEQVEDSPELATKFRAKILKNEPTSAWLLTSTVTTYCILRILDDLSGIAEPAERKMRLEKLYRHWENLHISEENLQSIKNGETKKLVKHPSGLKDFLNRDDLSPDDPRYKPLLHEQISLTIDDLRNLKFDPDKAKAIAGNDAETFFEWIASKKPLAQLPKLDGRDPNRKLPFYQNHPNGLFQFYRDSAFYLNIPQMAAAQRLKAATQRACFLWLLAESTGTKIDLKDQFTTKLPRHLHNEFADEDTRIDFATRLIDVSKHPLKLEKYPKNITVPNLFPN